MSDRYLNLADSESRALLAGASVLLVPMKPQPRVGRDQDGQELGDDYLVWESQKGDVIPLTTGCMYRIKQNAPYQPGDLLHGREAWSDASGTASPATTALYRASYGTPSGIFWRSAQHMPRWAVRHNCPILGCSPVKVSEITEELAEQTKLVHVGARARPFGTEPHQLACVNCGKHYQTHVGVAKGCAGGHGTTYSDLTYRGGLAWSWQSRWPKFPVETSWAWSVEMER